MKIKKILIANRGEIALRIIRTCKEMGIETVALCPQKDLEKHFLETKFADEFYYLDREGILGYLDQQKIIEIAKKAKVDAIHPGYGFLAENGDFADFCEANNIIFIGPSGDILRKVGNKIEAKKIAQKIGCPLLDGIERPIRDEKECKRIAKEIKTPFLLKAVDGGGGVGIEIIDDKNKAKLGEVFQRVKRVAEYAFGSDKIFIEKFLQSPRHIEFQIIADNEGNVVHLFERECSIQRRFQKLIEEAPSPFLDKKLRKKMGKFAVKLIKYLKYKSVGTVEFLVDKNRNFYFIEVNPRIQVEHPVTEIVTGVDIVEQQIKIANGEKLELKQRDIKISNWAMEFRICAEEPADHFQPRSGIITKYLPPLGKGIEIHSFCQVGQQIFPYFDSLIAKLIVFGRDRETVIRRAKRALDEFIIEGVPTLIPFYKVILENKSFIEGYLSTSFVKDHRIPEIVSQVQFPQGTVPSPPKVIEEIDQQELAFIVAKLYRQFRSKKGGPEVNKWRLLNRQEFLEE